MKPLAVALTAIFALVAPLAPRSAAAATTQTVVLAGGCFWGMQLVFESLKGVTSATAGYAGGSAPTAHYDIVSTGTTGHAESVEVVYDPSVISFDQLLTVYFRVAHDPTQFDRQGPDDGPQYRSEIFYTTARQKSSADSAIARLERERVFRAPIVTLVARLNGFYPAEAYHQNFAVRNPANPYIAINDIPKLRALRAEFPALLKPNAPAL